MIPFEAVLEAYHGEIYHYLLRVTGRATDADDLSQETFLRAYRAYRSLPPDVNPRAWLFAIATNLSKNHFRSLARRRSAYQKVSGVMAQERPAGVGPERAALSQEIGTRIETIVSALPLKQRAAFVQRKIYGLDYEAIGRSLDCSAESARAHVFQALKKIRLGLNGYAGPREERQR